MGWTAGYVLGLNHQENSSGTMNGVWVGAPGHAFPKEPVEKVKRRRDARWSGGITKAAVAIARTVRSYLHDLHGLGHHSRLL
jgi:hypothetical protein